MFVYLLKLFLQTFFHIKYKHTTNYWLSLANFFYHAVLSALHIVRALSVKRAKHLCMGERQLRPRFWHFYVNKFCVALSFPPLCTQREREQHDESEFVYTYLCFCIYVHIYIHTYTNNAAAHCWAFTNHAINKQNRRWEQSSCCTSIISRNHLIFNYSL